MNDLDRLQREYQDREARLKGSDRYSISNPAYRFMKSRLKLGILKLLEQHEKALTDRLALLEVGCGNGNVLMDLAALDADPRGLFGVDLILTRLQQARSSHPFLALACANGGQLPYSSGTFDLVTQFTVFSSILDDEIRRQLADEMQRVLRRGGLIMWYDFWWNPLNRQTRGIRPAEIYRLFPGCTFDFQKVTLAPPLARVVVPFSPRLALFLEGLGIFNTHYLAAITPKMESSL